jgi:predicted transcriptional regulator
MDEDHTSDLAEFTVQIVAAYLGGHRAAPSDVPALIGSVHQALGALRSPEVTTVKTAKLTPAQIRRSITPDALISFEDGRPYKTLKRHLSGRGLSIAAYREKWGLPDSYPTVSATYSANRSALAKALGLGARGPKAAAPITATAIAPDSSRAEKERATAPKTP